jgi:hypothetical protein
MKYRAGSWSTDPTRRARSPSGPPPQSGRAGERAGADHRPGDGAVAAPRGTTGGVTARPGIARTSRARRACVARSTVGGDTVRSVTTRAGWAARLTRPPRAARALLRGVAGAFARAGGIGDAGVQRRAGIECAHGRRASCEQDDHRHETAHAGLIQPTETSSRARHENGQNATSRGASRSQGHAESARLRVWRHHLAQGRPLGGVAAECPVRRAQR